MGRITGALAGGVYTTLMMMGMTPALGAVEADAPPDGRIGYVLTSLYWSIYQSDDDQQDCPQGFNIGPRGQYSALFPDDGPTPTVEQAQLSLESETWYPTAEPDGFPYYEPQTQYAYGLNLDDTIDPEDYLSPDGEEGIDNQLYRALGCIIGFRGPDGVEFIFEDLAIRTDAYNRLMIELSGVDSMSNDAEVEVSIYRGRDRLLTDASGDSIMPGGSQRIDVKWGKDLIRHMKGEIVDSVLTTEPIPDLIIPWQNLGVPTFQVIRDMRVRLDLTATHAKGLIAGYADIDTYYKQLIRNDSTHHLSNGDISGISLYKKLRQVGDAYPDPETGANTAVSASLDAEFVQVYINPLSDEEKAELEENQ